MPGKRKYYKALTIAGSDSGGGAGIQADLKTFSANGVYGMSVITALTAQNTKEVSDIHPVPVDFIKKQFTAVMEDIGVDAIKIGMLHNSEVIHTIVRLLKNYKVRNVVVDPVMVATSGGKLLEDSAIATLTKELLPLATVITPNIPEAELILNTKITAREDFTRAARDLAQTGAGSVLLKSGHLKDRQLTDIFYIPSGDQLIEIPYERVKTNNTHGTGCTLSSAIAAWIARGSTLEQAIHKGLDYTHLTIARGSAYRLGGGNGPVHHFYQYWS
jgi:hydroxymethylpyrimidine/phosphomethylpyrimidine kinase